MRLRTLLAAAAVALVVTAPAESANPQIAGLQVALRAYGFYLGPIDGVSGQQTATAVRAFQRSSRLAVDGVPGATTRRALGRLGTPLYGKRTLLQRPGRLGRLRAPVPARPARRRPGDRRLLRSRDRARRASVPAPREPRRRRDRGTRDPARARGRVGRARGCPTAATSSAPGDSLTAIAERHGTSLRSLASTNRIDPARPLLIGTRLRIPRGGRRRRWPLRRRPSARRSPQRPRSYGVDPSLARAVAWMESGFQPHVVSSAGALGVMQVTPPTWDFVETVLLGANVPKTTRGQHPDRRRLPPAPPPRVRRGRAARARRLLPGREGSSRARSLRRDAHLRRGDPLAARSRLSDDPSVRARSFGSVAERLRARAARLSGGRGAVDHR